MHDVPAATTEGSFPALARLASVVLGIGAIVFGGLAVLAMVSGGFRLSGPQWGVWVAVPMLCAVAAVGLLRLTGATRIAAVLLLAVTVPAIVVADLAITILAERLNPPRDAEPRRAQLRELRARGIPTTLRVPGLFLALRDASLRIGDRTLHPLTTAPAGYVVQLCDEDFPIVTFRADRYGFDNPDTLWNRSSVDVAVLGDSYAAGVCVAPWDAIPGRLRERRSVLNLAISGAGPLQELALLREYAATKTPRVVVWIYYEGNDQYDIRNELPREWLTAYLDPAHRQGLDAPPPGFDSLYGEWIRQEMTDSGSSSPSIAARLQGSVRLTTLRRLINLGVPFPTRRSAISRMPEILARAQADVQAWGGQLLLVFHPAYRRYTSLFGDAYPGRDELMAVADSLRIPTVDLHEAFTANGDPRGLWRSPRGHLSAAGYGVASTAIAKAVDSLWTLSERGATPKVAAPNLPLH